MNSIIILLNDDGNSDNQSAFHFSNTGFFNKLLIVLLKISAKTAPKELFLECLLRARVFIIIISPSVNLDCWSISGSVNDRSGNKLFSRRIFSNKF